MSEELKVFYKALLYFKTHPDQDVTVSSRIGQREGCSGGETFHFWSATVEFRQIRIKANK